MSLPLDPRTLFAVIAAVFAALVVAMASVCRQTSGMAGLGRLTLGLGLIGAGCALRALEGRAADFVAIVLAILLIGAGCAAVLEGTRRFYGRGTLRAFTAPLVLASVLAAAYYLYVDPSVNARIVAANAAAAACLAPAAWTVYAGGRREGGGSVALVTAACFGLLSAALALRAVLTAAGARSEGDVMAGDPLTGWGLLVAPLFSIVWTLGLVGLANRRLMAASRQAEDQLRAQKDLHANLVAVARATTRRPELRATLHAALEVVESLTGAAASSLILLGDHGSVRDAVISRRGVRTMEPVHAGQLLREGLAGWVARERRTALVGDVRHDARWLSLPSGDAMRSALSVPVTAGDDLVAVLTLVHPEARHFGEEHLRLIEAATVQIAMALRNARLLEDVSAHRARLAAVIESTRDGLVLVAGGRLLLLSARAVALLGLREPPGAWLGRPLADLLEVLRPALPASTLADWARLPDAADVAGGGETRLGNASIVWTSVGVPTVGRLLVLRDVTAERHAERLRESLTHMLVHDLRQPLTAILGAFDLTKDAEGLSAQQRSLLALAERSALRQLELIDAVLDLARLEQQALPVEPEAVSVGELADEVLRLAAPRAAAKDITLATTVARDLPRAWADPALLGRVLENLVGNAIKFTPRGGSATVSAEATRDGRLRVDVRDTGPGVTAELAGRLFRKFTTGNLEGKGSGLGLAFCRLAVEAHGGRLWLEPGPGPGATFSFTLPTAAGASDASAPGP